MKKLFCFCIALLLICSSAFAFDCSHTYGEWEIKEAATASAKGIKTRKCAKCGKNEYESFYPQGTLYKGISGREEDIVNLHDALILMGYDTNTDEYYSDRTEAAVKAFQKDNGLEVTGIAYPDTLNALDVRVDSPFSEVSFAGIIVRDNEACCAMAHRKWTPDEEFFIPCAKHAPLAGLAESFAEEGYSDVALSVYRQLIIEEATAKNMTDITEACTAANTVEEMRTLLISICATEDR